MCSHVPNRGEQMVRYYGHYSNVSRGKRKRQDQDGLIPSILEPDGSSNEHRKNWARLIQKIYEADPLTCPKCSGKMKILSFIEDPEVIKKILKHLGLWDIKARPPPKATATPQDFHIDYVYFVEDVYFYKSRMDSQIPPCEDYLFHDPDYPIEAYAQA